MRGNPGHTRTAAKQRRSIPAYAGEPHPARESFQQCQVYPRVCGGTGHPRRRKPHAARLSPRMRGNRADGGCGWLRRGSIPAYAGEPRRLPSAQRTSEVYPRVCGGTRSRPVRRKRGEGLSPRMRGNPRIRSPAASLIRSIPAYAGEPPAARAGQCGPRVYPRVCGGTPPLG